MFRLLTLTVVIYEILLFKGMQGWVYHHDDITMMWEDARNYCKKNYTDMVAIQNMEENKFLMEYLPKGYAQVWIGLRLINNSWTWIGTNRKLENVAMNWVPGEPSNGKNNEDCVVMYIQAAANSGKWSNEPCMNMKRPLCFQASCTPDSCNGHGECVETIGAFTCACNEGFYGDLCEIVLRCLRLEARDPVIMSCSHPYKNFSYDSTCDFSCAEGFKLNGERRVQCTASAEWTKPIPECKAVRCKRLEFSRRDVMNCFGPHGPFRYNSTCKFGCREGYVLKGSERIQCLASGQWTERPPLCRVQQCETLVVPEHGNMSCIPPIAKFKYNSTCDFSCSEGFALNGPSRLRCKDPEQWSAPNPTCEAVKCSELTAPPNLIMNCSGPFSYSSICDFSCKDGFDLQGSDRLRCDVSGQWTSKIPICKAVQCMPLNIPHRGNMNCKHMYGNNSYNATCVFSCTEGFILHGSNDLQCQASRQWTAEVPSCEAINCTTLVNPEQGTVNCSHPFGLFRYNATCDVSCEKGFIVNGSSTVQCGASGQWTPQIPSCKAMKCDMLRNPERGSYNCIHPIDDFSYNSSCDFSCAEGFTLMGSDRLECRASGQWTAQPPTCSVVTCQTITQPEQGMINCTHPIGNFSYSSICGFGCAKGFVLQGSGVLKCESSGQWTADTPSCKAVTCQTLTRTAKGAMNCSHPFGNFSYSSTCDFSCMEGFALKGSERLQCQDNGQWTAQNPNCEVIICDKLVQPEQGKINCSNPIGVFSYSSTCEFSCADGFLLNGSDWLRCQATGQWSAQNPICKAITCQELINLEQVSMNCSNPIDEFSYNSTCDFSCIDGFVLNGSNRLQCQANGQWTAQSPNCEAINCRMLTEPVKGVMNCSHPIRDFSYRSTCDFSCSKGFILNGSDRLQCQATGQWTAPSPNCKAINCPALLNLDQGSMNCSHPIDEFSYNSTCDFSCSDGFILSGSNRLHCRANGQWTAEMPSCKAINCRMLTEPARGAMDCSHPIKDFSYRSKCDFNCSKGFILNGSDHLQCQATGQWTAPIPNCKAINCRMLTEPVKGVMNCSHPIRDFSYRSTCDFSCSKGFILNGSDRLQCQATGQWTAPSPNCKAINCPALLNLDQGSMNCSHPIDEFSYNSTCDFSCTDGFILRGSNRLHCRANGQWTAEMPSCKAINCRMLTEPVKGVMNCSHPIKEFSYTSTCDFSCSKGFILNGSDHLQCQATGQWTAPSPNCKAINCPELLNLDQGSMNCSHPIEEFSYSSTCDFSCSDGFILRGSNKLQCRANGQWTAEMPICKAVKCNGLRIPKRGTMNCTHPIGDYNYQSVCAFDCVEGFILKGMDVLKCTDSGKWTDEFPHCEVVKCQELKTTLPMIMNCSHPLGNFSYNSVCDFDCMKGFVLKTPVRLQCNKSGQWTEDIPLCNVFKHSTKDFLLYVGATGGTAVFGLIIAMTIIWIRRKLKSQEDDSKMLTSNSVEIAQDTFENPTFVNTFAE